MYIEKKQYILGLVLFMVSGNQWGSENISPTDKRDYCIGIVQKKNWEDIKSKSGHENKPKGHV